ncbi:MAG: redoxin domain-containing protein [Crocinitomicaceae bacterium]|nr:redoxin domain-containing protein [Crocinitomicaceae bacterium]
MNAQDQMYDVCPLKVGEEIPDSVLLTQTDGERVEFGELLNEGKSIVVFYRGGWCRYCTRHLNALGQIKNKIDSLGYTLYGVTLDQFDSLAVSEMKSQTDYTLLSDNRAELTSAFGLR